MKKSTLTECTRCKRPLRIWANGLCHGCYTISRFSENKVNLIVCSKCKCLKTHHSKGLCATCYKVEWAKQKRHNGTISEKEKERKKKADKAYYQSHKDEIKIRTAKYSKTHIDEIKVRGIKRRQTDEYKAYMRKFRERHQSKQTIKAREQRKNNPEIHKKHKHDRRARIKGLEHTLTSDQWLDILSKYDNSCAYCGIKNVPLDQEHKIPVSRGGGYTAENIVPACGKCNHRKGTMTESDFREYLKKYPR